MGSLAECLDGLDASKATADYILDQADKLRDAGLSVQQAEAKAVRDLLESTRQDRLSVVGQIKAAMAAEASEEQPDEGEPADVQETSVKSQPLNPRIGPTGKISPKSERVIIEEIGKALNTPIRFGRLMNPKSGGFFNRVTNLIAVRRANDIESTSHEVGHRLDKEIKLSSDKAIRNDLLWLGADPNSRPGSLSSWTPSKPTSYRLSEGVAELVRYWVTDPDALTNSSSGVYAKDAVAAFETLLKNNPSLDKAMRRFQKDVQDRLDADPVERFRSQIVRAHKKRRTPTKDEILGTIINDLHMLAVADKHSEKAMGGKLKPTDSIHTLGRLLRGRGGVLSVFLERGTVNAKTKEVTLGNSLVDALRPLGDRVREWEDWMASLQVLEMEKRGLEHGFYVGDAKAVVNKHKGDKAFQEARKKFRAWQDSLIDYAVDGGKLSKKSAEIMRDTWKQYISMQRVFEPGAGESPAVSSSGGGKGMSSGTPPSLRRRRGSPRDVLSPLETTISNAQSIIDSTDKFMIGQAILRAARRPDMARFFEAPVAIPMISRGLKVASIRKQLEDLGADLSNVDDEDVIRFYQQMEQPPRQENTIRVMDVKTKVVNGEVVEVHVPVHIRMSPEMYRTFNALDHSSSNPVLRMLAMPAALQRMGVVLDVFFGIANVVKDNLASAVLSKHRLQVPFEPVFRGFAAILGNKKLAAEFYAAGAGMSVEALAYDRVEADKWLRKQIGGTDSARQKIANTVMSPFQGLKLLAGLAEEATRIGEYQIALNAYMKQGMSEEDARRQAAFDSRDRQDFLKGGSMTREVRQISAFWNAAIQGNVTFFNRFKEHPLWTSMLGFTYITVPTLMQLWLNWDDDDYWDRPQWERDQYLLIPTGTDESGHTAFLRIPQPHIPGFLFGTIWQRVISRWKDRDPEAASSLMQDFISQAIPIPNPSGALTLFEAGAGRQGWSNWRSRPIVDAETASLPKRLQFNDRTSWTGKTIGSFFNMSPMKVDYVIGQMTGGVGKAATGQQAPWRRFSTSPLNVSNQPNNDFYFVRDELAQEQAGRRRTGDVKGLGPVMLKQFDKAADDMSRLRDAVERAPDEKKPQLREKIYRLARKTVADYRRNKAPQEAVNEYTAGMLKLYLFDDMGKPEQGANESDDSYQDRLIDWQDKRDYATRWLIANKSNPKVKLAIENYKLSKKYQDSTDPGSVPRYNSWKDLEKLNRWNARSAAASDIRDRAAKLAE